MTRKPLPKVIVAREDWRTIAGSVVVDHEAPAPAPRSALPSDRGRAGPVAAISALPVAAAPARVGPQAERRLAVARNIVERHKLYAAMGGLFPLAVVNVAGVTAIVLRMVKQLSDIYEVPFERERTRSIVIGLMGGAVPTGLGAAAASTLAFAVPGGAVVGLAVSSITAAALTRGIGLVFVDHFENGAMVLGAAEPEPA
jgi:uncharacterized protein (DUF697 family)